MNSHEIAQKLIELANELDPETLQGRGQSAPDLWEIKIKKGQTIEDTIKECEKHFEVWRWTYDNLDQIVNSDRTSEKEYTIKVKANIEADENLKNMSVNDLKEKGVKGITLLERLVLELQYFKETGKHLDIENVTLCSGSRYSDGSVPYVGWYSSDSKMHVVWFLPDSRYSYLRSRGVVS